jgi:hypothetical protein
MKALDFTDWKTRFGRGCRPAVRLSDNDDGGGGDDGGGDDDDAIKENLFDLPTAFLHHLTINQS